MKIYLLTDDAYHENTECYGVFSTLEKAQEAAIGSRHADRIYIFELDKKIKNFQGDYVPARDCPIRPEGIEEFGDISRSL